MNTSIHALILAFINSSIVAALTLAIRALIPRRLATSRAAVCAASLVCVLILTLFSIIPLSGLFPDLPSSPSVSNVQIASNPLTNKTVQSNSAKIATSGSASQSDSSTLQISTAWLRRVGQGVQRALVAVDSTSNHWAEWLFAIIVAGGAINLIRLVASLSSIRQLHRASTPIQDASLIGILSNQMHANRSCRKINLRETDQFATAATFGILTPVILFPTTWREWSSEELSSVLAHELAHIHRFDFLHRLIARLCTAIYFYHPLIRAVANKLIIDQEFAADSLAGESQLGNHTYLRGLALLALRFDLPFSESSTTIAFTLMPNASDFLIRRLQMLRTKEGSSRRHTARIVSVCATFGIVSAALLAILFSSSTSLAAKPRSAPQSPRIASLPNKYATATKTEPNMVATQKPEPKATDQPTPALFTRSAFDTSILKQAGNGAFLIRIGELARNPDTALLIDRASKELTEWNRKWSKSNVTVDLRRDVEWIAGGMTAKFAEMTPEMKARYPNPSADGTFMMSSGFTYIRLVRSTTCKEIADSIPGAALKTVNGHECIELPVIPDLGPGHARLRLVDNKTIMFADGSTPEKADKAEELFFDDTPRKEPYAWESTWRNVDGGLVTCVIDHSQDGWSKLPKAKRHECPEVFSPLLEKPKYYAFGWDCMPGGPHSGDKLSHDEPTSTMSFRIRGTCDDQQSVQKMYLAAAVLLNRWPEVFKDEPENLEKYHSQLLQFFAGIKFQPSPPDADEHFLDVSAQTPLKSGELAKLLQYWLDNM